MDFIFSCKTSSAGCHAWISLKTDYYLKLLFGNPLKLHLNHFKANNNKDLYKTLIEH